MILGGVHTCIHTCRSISVNIDKKREDKCQCIHVDVGESLTVLTKPKKACREDAIERDPATKLQVVLQGGSGQILVVKLTHAQDTCN